MTGVRRISLTLGAASALSAGAGLIHVRAATGHAEESTLYAVLFAALAAWQVGWAAAILLASSRRPLLLRLGALVSIGVVAVWATSRTSGLPIGPEPGHAEAIGVPDTIATLDELAVAALVGLRLSSPRSALRGLARLADVAALALGLVTAVAFVTVAHVG